MILEMSSAETGFPRLQAALWNLDRGNRALARDWEADRRSIEQPSRTHVAVNYIPWALWADLPPGQPADQAVWPHGEGQYGVAAANGLALEPFGNSLYTFNLQRGCPNTALLVSGSIFLGQPLIDASGHPINPINVQEASPITALGVTASILYGQPLQVLVEYNLGVPNTTAYVASWSPVRSVEIQHSNRAELQAPRSKPREGWVTPAEENWKLLQIATETQHAIEVSSVIFEGSRSLSPDERADQRKFYKKTYRKI